MTRLLTEETLAAAMRSRDDVAWPKRWTDGDFAWVARQVIASLAEDPSDDDVVAWYYENAGTLRAALEAGKAGGAE